MGKDNANRIQKQVYLNYVKVQLILFKDNVYRITEASLLELCLGAAYPIQR